MTTPSPPLPNEAASRTPEGALLNQVSTTPQATTTDGVQATPPATPTPDPAATPEPKPAEGKSLLNDGKPAPSQAPDKYETFKVPDGFELDPKVSEEAGALFKAANLPQESAQKFVDFYVSKLNAVAQAPFEAWKTMQEGWATQVKADPDIGGKLDQVRETVSRALDSLGDAKLAADFREAMDITGVGNHPAFVKAFYRFAQKVTEGTRVPGGGPVQVTQPGQGRPSVASALFPNLK